MKLTQFLFIVFFLFNSNCVFAYLDPGSGSAIVGVITAAIGSIWFSLKSLFYRFKGKSSSEGGVIVDDDSIVLFSEGRSYWGTFCPLIHELINREIPFRYITLDLYDPGLMIDNNLMKSKLISLNSINISEITKVKAKCVISTTPNIGTPGYPIAKSPYIERLIHVFHHVGDISIYKKNSLDHYDDVILVGDFQKKAIIEIEKLRALKPKNLVSLGLPYLDSLYKNKLESNDRNKEITILVGSSWGEKGCLRNYGTDFINDLAAAGFNIIVRAHPQSAKSEPEFIEACKKATNNHNVRWDDDVSPSKSMQTADLLISDTSSLRFDFAFLYEKPIITLNIPKESLSEFESSDLNESWYDTASYKIGLVINPTSMLDICTAVDEMLESNLSSDIKLFRDETVKNFGSSAECIVSYIDELNNSESVYVK